jgi:hypothetical protein
MKSLLEKGEAMLNAPTTFETTSLYRLRLIVAR